jgi:molybdopterin-guanine dinucleotide biosynthesis protein A
MGYVLAGGRSRRFGSNKALADLLGTTMLVRMGNLLTKLTDHVAVVGAPEIYSRFGFRCVTDRWPGEGPLGGVTTALLDTAAIHPEITWNLVVSCDLPFLTLDAISYITEFAVRSQADAIIPESEHGLEPLCACYRTRVGLTLQNEFERGTRKLLDAVKCIRVEHLPQRGWNRFKGAERLFWNMNSPEEYQKTIQIFNEGE